MFRLDYRTSANQRTRNAPSPQNPCDTCRQSENYQSHENDAKHGRQASGLKPIVGHHHKYEMTKIDTECQTSQSTQPPVLTEPASLQSDKEGNGHHHYIYSAEIPNDLKIGIIAGVAFLQPHISTGRCTVTGNKHNG